MKNYTPGFYWVHFKDNYEDDWTIAELTSKGWFIIGDEDSFDISDFFEVGSKIERM